MINVFKILDTGFDDSITSMLPLNSTGLRGHSRKLFIEQSSKDIRKFNFTMRVRKIWNSLPDRVVNSKDIINFERQLDDFWKDQDILYNDYNADIKL